MAFQNPKGTVDFYPEEKRLQDYVFNNLRKTAKSFNFQEIESPGFETMGLLTKKSGEEIKGQIFNLEKKGNEEFGLRFDMTVPAARMFIQRQKSAQKPVKWFYLTRMWRYEQPQKGRLREFYQFGTEIFGSGNAAADAEIINLAIASLESLGLKKGDFYVYINNRKLITGLLLSRIKEEQIDFALSMIDKYRKLSDEDFLKELSQNKINESQADEILEIIKKSEFDKTHLNKLAQEGYGELNAVLALIKDKDFVKVDLSIVRGLAYYTGTVFEIYDSGRKFRAICGGGRYDNLIELFEGENTGATGFGMGYSTLSLLLEEKKLVPNLTEGPDYFVAYVKKENLNDAYSMALELRDRFSVEIDLNSRNLSNQLQYANSIKAKKVIFVGENELKSGTFKVKDMGSGSESSLRKSPDSGEWIFLEG
jgi:histidyl-tRNA synthetase